MQYMITVITPIFVFFDDAFHNINFFRPEIAFSHFYRKNIRFRILILSFQNIVEVKVIKRPLEWFQFGYIELRIGNKNMAGSGAVQFTEDDNPLVGCHGPAKSDAIHEFYMTEGVSGRYMTFQRVDAWYMAIDEVVVFR